MDEILSKRKSLEQQLEELKGKNWKLLPSAKQPSSNWLNGNAKIEPALLSA